MLASASLQLWQIYWGIKIHPITWRLPHKVEQQGYKPCAGLMKLADKYTPDRLEHACERALSYTPEPSLKNITVILQNGQDKRSHEKPASKSGSKYGITRGASYYGGGDRS